jgi:CRISPR system Cascade subunit CasE
MASPGIIHGAIEQGFPGDRRRNLWRIDWLNGSCYLLVVSDVQPSFAHLTAQFGYPEEEPAWETKDYEPLLSMLADGQEWRFRLRANPVHSVRGEDPLGRGKIYAHITPERQKKWLSDRADSLGFSVVDERFDIVHREWKKFRKYKDGGRRIAINFVTFEGLLRITDVDLFREALVGGIGRAKAYGCGMLTLAK